MLPNALGCREEFVAETFLVDAIPVHTVWTVSFVDIFRGDVLCLQG